MFARLVFLTGLVAVAFAEHNWYVKNPATNYTCLIVDADPLIHVNFNNGTNSFRYDVAIENVTSFTGNCDVVRGNASLQQLTVNFVPAGATARTAKQWSLDLFFQHNTSTDFELVDYKLTTAQMDTMEGSKSTYFEKDPNAVTDVKASGTNAYKCSKNVLSLVNETTVDMKGFRAIAFASLNATEFPAEQVYEQCLADSKTSDVVPIIVGACLAGLVVVVLVAYLIGRARAKRQGYASV